MKARTENLSQVRKTFKTHFINLRRRSTTWRWPCSTKSTRCAESEKTTFHVFENDSTLPGPRSATFIHTPTRRCGLIPEAISCWRDGAAAVVAILWYCVKQRRKGEMSWNDWIKLDDRLSGKIGKKLLPTTTRYYLVVGRNKVPR